MNDCNPLSLENWGGGGTGAGLLQPSCLNSDFPTSRFCFLLGLPFGQFTKPNLSRCPCIYDKKIPAREEVATKINKFS